jgi:hypothetical protein
MFSSVQLTLGVIFCPSVPMMVQNGLWPYVMIKLWGIGSTLRGLVCIHIWSF